MRVVTFLTPYWIHIGTYLGIIILDQWTKSYAATHRIFYELTSFIKLLYVENTGIAFSLPLTGALLQVVTVLLLLGILWGIAYYELYKDRILFFFVMVLLAGAVGNAIDRLSLGYVVDFISVGSFPVFNIADSAVTVGAVGALIRSHFKSPSS